jgi:hypothetical protein
MKFLMNSIICAVIIHANSFAGIYMYLRNYCTAVHGCVWMTNEWTVGHQVQAVEGDTPAHTHSHMHTQQQSSSVCVAVPVPRLFLFSFLPGGPFSFFVFSSSVLGRSCVLKSHSAIVAAFFVCGLWEWGPYCVIIENFDLSLSCHNTIPSCGVIRIDWCHSCSGPQ